MEPQQRTVGGGSALKCDEYRGDSAERAYEPANFPPVAPARIEPQTYKSVTLTPLAGVLRCGKYLPLRLMNSMVLEFTLARTDDALAPAAEPNLSRDFEL